MNSIYRKLYKQQVSIELEPEIFSRLQMFWQPRQCTWKCRELAASMTLELPSTLWWLLHQLLVKTWIVLWEDAQFQVLAKWAKSKLWWQKDTKTDGVHQLLKKVKIINNKKYAPTLRLSQADMNAYMSTKLNTIITAVNIQIPPIWHSCSWGDQRPRLFKGV